MLLLKLRNQLGFNSIKETGNFRLTFIRTEITNVKKQVLFAGVKKKNDTAIKGVSTNSIFSIQCALHVHGSRTK